MINFFLFKECEILLFFINILILDYLIIIYIILFYNIYKNILFDEFNIIYKIK